MLNVVSAMSWPAVSVPPWLNAGDALRYAEFMGVHRLPVVEGGAVVGALCTCELYAADAHAPVSHSMRMPAPTVDKAAALHDVFEHMRAEGISWVCVAGLEAPGVLTLGDIERAGLFVDAAESAQLHCPERDSPPSHVRVK